MKFYCWTEALQKSSPSLVGAGQERQAQLAEGITNVTKGEKENAQKVSLTQKEFTII